MLTPTENLMPAGQPSGLSGIAGYAVRRSICGVWLCCDYRNISVARAVAEDAMRALDLDPDDFRTRDRLTMAISPRTDGMLSFVRLSSPNKQVSYQGRSPQVGSSES